MHKGLAFLATAAFLAIALSGCSSGSKDGFSVKSPGAAGGEYVFTANGSADNYTWDLGDRLTTAYGKTVHHTYDFKNGVITVSLTTKKGTETSESRQEITLGTGKNDQPTFILEAPYNWTITGETMTFSAAKSTDPDGDPLRYTWSCVRSGDAVRKPTHVHPGFGGVPFATPPAGTVTARDATGAMPKPDKTYPGDLCDALGSGGKPTKDSTIQGTFTKTGIYDVYLLASDPVHPTTSGKYHFAVTTPEERPARLYTSTFVGNFTGGNSNALQSACDQAQPGTMCDYHRFSFSLPLQAGGPGWAELTWTPTYSGTDAAINATWILFRGTIQVARGAANSNVTLPQIEMKQAGFNFDVFLSGPGATLTGKVAVPLDMDPFKVY